jgi:hypothetical protein
MKRKIKRTENIIKMLFIAALKCFENYTIEGEKITAHIQVVPNRCLLAV